MTKSPIEQASEILDVSIDDIKDNFRIIDGTNAWRFWTTTGGGGAVIIDYDESYLYAPSSVSEAEHINRFKAGKRSTLGDKTGTFKPLPKRKTANKNIEYEYKCWR